MGKRLYPNTTNPASLETLCGVPAGTHARLMAIEARHAKEAAECTLAGMARQEWEYKQWCEVNDDEALGTLSGFLIFGWGKFDGGSFAPGYAGRIGDNLIERAQVMTLLHMNGIKADAALCEGVCWS